MTETTGRCLCGACVMTIEPGPEAGACHCDFCRKWSGGIFIAVDAKRPVRFADDAPIGVYRSSEWAERVFCRTCGSSLLWRSVDGQHNAVSVQVFDDPAAFPVTSEIFTDRKPVTYALAGSLNGMTGPEFMAQFSPDEEG
ncbi:GFA family protein [Paracoccus sp. 1_MG-2023]|uniref:GFA family protein n=1 Tax=unclassified Paracoccus (in: a-proteobacteria) TaxID=2688777 RepID=UPI001C0868DB|nr:MULTISPECIES: GFA family protein [unclassified Paracoccus (in: a-proteobacteria)]MBU2958213.1 GFA family protein [Paracoccus sp. C2R09]MDO6668340.1 GFA family protein [Paracoccus sp. 1_MG-2023]